MASSASVGTSAAAAHSRGLPYRLWSSSRKLHSHGVGARSGWVAKWAHQWRCFRRYWRTRDEPNPAGRARSLGTSPKSAG